MFGMGKGAIDATGNAIEKTGTVLDNLFTSDEERAAADQVMAKLRQNPEKWAHALNLINANDDRFFNSGWRPGLGWVLVIAALLYFIPQYAMATIMWVKVSWGAAAITEYPIGDGALWQLAALLLGNGLLRTYEKAKGVAK